MMKDRKTADIKTEKYTSQRQKKAEKQGDRKIKNNRKTERLRQKHKMTKKQMETNFDRVRYNHRHLI